MELGLGVLRGELGGSSIGGGARGRGGMEESAECGRRGVGILGRGEMGSSNLETGQSREEEWESAGGVGKMPRLPWMMDGRTDGAPFRPGPERGLETEGPLAQLVATGLGRNAILHRGDCT
jgi:hypothetical protein